jgi:hypothetical protein
MARARAGLRRGPNDWVLEIKDARLRLLVDIHLAKLAEAERLIREFVPPGMEIRFDDRSSARSDFRLNDIERRAIEYLTSEDFLKSRDFELGKRADVLDSEGRSVFKPGTLDALNKVLKYL